GRPRGALHHDLRPAAERSPIPRPRLPSGGVPQKLKRKRDLLIRRLVLAILAAALPVVAVVASSVLPSAAPPAAATSPNVNAYWLVASDGGIFSFGGAHFYGSTGGTVLNRPVVGMAATHDG